VATKYPALTERYFSERGIQVEMIRLDGSIELAPLVGLAERIVDLVQSGETLRANGLVEVAEIMSSTARLIVNRASLKTAHSRVNALIAAMRQGSCQMIRRMETPRWARSGQASTGRRRPSARSTGASRDRGRRARQGDVALLEFTERFERRPHGEARVTPSELDAAERTVGDTTMRALRYAAGGSSASIASPRRAHGG
jgi:hypothetical protein